MDQLLRTKLAAPVIRDRLVTRPHLIKQLEDGLLLDGCFQRKLTLLSAPAGYGKTTLAAGWLHSTGRLFTWYSLDETDNDPSRFLAYLVEAVCSVGSGTAARQALSSPQPPPAEAVLSTLINEVSASPQEIILVVDDYHVLHNPQVQEMGGFLLENLPSRLHLVLITREDPLLPIPRLRARGQVLEIRQEALRFTAAETHEFLTYFMQLDLRDEDVAALERRTEGWVAGLQLAALSVRASADPQGFIQAFTGSNRYILDYLVSEVFEQQPAAVQEFLLKTAILKRMSGPLCDSLTGQPSSQAMLAYLEQENLFIIPLDEAREWYRYHHLFAEFLLHRLRERGPVELASLHQSASRWYEAQGFIAEAIEHALAAADFGQATALVAGVEDKMLQRGEIATLLAWFKQLPEAMLRSSVELCLGYAWPLLLSGQGDLAESLLNCAEPMIAEGTPEQGNLYAQRAYLARSRDDQTSLIHASERALALLPQTAQAARGVLAMNLGIAYWHSGSLDETEIIMSGVQRAAAQTGFVYGELTARFFSIRTLATRGRLHQAEPLYIQMIQENQRIPIAALAHFDLGTLYREWNRLAEAEQHLSQGMEISAQTGNKEFLSSGHILQAQILLARKDPRAALAEAERAYELARDFPPSVLARCAALRARTALALGDLEQAERWVLQVPPGADAHPLYRFLDLTHPLVFIAQGKKEKASELLAPARQAAQEHGWGYALVAVQTLQALAARTVEAALEPLTEALQMAELEGYLGTFLDAGSGLAPLLQEAARRGIYPQQAGQILAALGAPAARHIPGLVEPLSEREVEVLRLVAAGLSNRQIARQLVITPGTAKTHIHNICGKLNARNRTEAAVRARELEIV